MAVYSLGSTIDLCLRNNSRTPYFSNHQPLYQIFDEQNKAVYNSPYIAISGSPTGIFTYFAKWYQKNNFGLLVPEGIYTLKFIEFNPIVVTKFTITHNSYNTTPYIVLDKYSGLPNSAKISIKGYLFIPYESINISFLNQYININADVNGNFQNNELYIPFSKTGHQTISIKALTSKKSFKTDFYIDGFYPNISLDKTYVLPGQTISLKGSDYAPFESINVDSTNKDVLSKGSIAADIAGNFNVKDILTVSLKISNTKFNLKLSGAKSNSSQSVEITIGQYYPQINPSTYYVNKNSLINVNGINYPQHQTINISVNGKNEINTTTDSNGDFTLRVRSPNIGNSFELKAIEPISGSISKRTITIAK